MEITKILLYIVIVIKVLFLAMFLYYKFLSYRHADKDKLKDIKMKEDVFHESFIIFTYVLLILLFNPFKRDIILHNNPKDSYHFQIVIFALAIIQLSNFSYTKLWKTPEILL